MKMFEEIFPPPRRLLRYRTVARADVEKVRKLAQKLRSTTVVHINSTAAGGGVVELLKSQVPLEQDLGLRSRWFVLKAPSRFFAITKKIHDLLQGRRVPSLTEKEKQYYRDITRAAGMEWNRIRTKERPAIVVIHDPQPLPLISVSPAERAAVLRIHIDLAAADSTTLEFLRPWIQQYPRVIISSPRYRPVWLPRGKTRVIMPAIDPFTDKNRRIPLSTAHRVLENLAIHPKKPLVSQVSRFDPWKDPTGVIRAYHKAKNSIPELQLALVGSFSVDDPDGKELHRVVKKLTRGDHDVALSTDEDALLVNAVQTASTVVIQKSLREGFGLTMTEAMGKGKAVIAGRTEGARLQIKNGKNGILVSSPEEAASAIVSLIRNPTQRARIGKAARASVRKNFLFPRFLVENLKLYVELMEK